MCRAFLSLLLGAVAVFAVSASASEPTGKIAKVLPLLLDLQGRHTVSPSLFDRDAYQAELRKHPEKCSGIRYDVLWQAYGAKQQPLTLRVELKGLFGEKVFKSTKIESQVTASSSTRRWTGLSLVGEDFKAFGKITAWRATLWSGDRMLDEQKSFLW